MINLLLRQGYKMQKYLNELDIVIKKLPEEYQTEFRKLKRPVVQTIRYFNRGQMDAFQSTVDYLKAVNKEREKTDLRHLETKIECAKIPIEDWACECGKK